MGIDQNGPEMFWNRWVAGGEGISVDVGVECNTRAAPGRILYVFDPRRVAFVPLGGDRTGDERRYERNVPLADRLYDKYLAEIEEEDDAKDDKVQ